MTLRAHDICTFIKLHGATAAASTDRLGGIVDPNNQAELASFFSSGIVDLVTPRDGNQMFDNVAEQELETDHCGGGILETIPQGRNTEAQQVTVRARAESIGTVTEWSLVDLSDGTLPYAAIGQRWPATALAREEPIGGPAETYDKYVGQVALGSIANSWSLAIDRSTAQASEVNFDIQAIPNHFVDPTEAAFETAAGAGNGLPLAFDRGPFPGLPYITSSALIDFQYDLEGVTGANVLTSSTSTGAWSINSKDVVNMTITIERNATPFSPEPSPFLPLDLAWTEQIAGNTRVEVQLTVRMRTDAYHRLRRRRAQVNAGLRVALVHRQAGLFTVSSGQSITTNATANETVTGTTNSGGFQAGDVVVLTQPDGNGNTKFNIVPLGAGTNATQLELMNDSDAATLNTGIANERNTYVAMSSTDTELVSAQNTAFGLTIPSMRLTGGPESPQSTGEFRTVNMTFTATPAFDGTGLLYIPTAYNHVTAHP